MKGKPMSKTGKTSDGLANVLPVYKSEDNTEEPAPMPYAHDFPEVTDFELMRVILDRNGYDYETSYGDTYACVQVNTKFADVVPGTLIFKRDGGRFRGLAPAKGEPTKS